jgi:hypothetical protein
MQRSSRDAVVQRLQFAAAELEVVGEIAKWEGEAALMEQLRALTKRVRDCINRVASGNTGGRFPENQDVRR